MVDALQFSFLKVINSQYNDRQRQQEKRRIQFKSHLEIKQMEWVLVVLRNSSAILVFHHHANHRLDCSYCKKVIKEKKNEWMAECNLN